MLLAAGGFEMGSQRPRWSVKMCQNELFSLSVNKGRAVFVLLRVEVLPDKVYNDTNGRRPHFKSIIADAFSGRE